VATIYYRLPSLSLTRGGVVTIVAAAHDGVVAPHEVVGGGGILVAGSFAAARHASMRAVYAESVSPTIVHGVAGTNRRTQRRWSSRSRGRGIRRLTGAGIVLGGTGIACALSGELALSFGVCLGEMGLEEDERPQGVVEITPLVAGRGEDAGFFENREDEIICN
jgi:hypothetical protein